MSEYILGNIRIDVERKIIDGEEYILSNRHNGKELWLPAAGLKIEKRKCAKCGYSGVALDEHHIHGRKNSDETIILCANCHREYHMKYGYKMEKP